MAGKQIQNQSFWWQNPWQVPILLVTGTAGHRWGRSWPGLGLSHLKHQNFQLWRNAVANVPQRNGGERMRQPSYNSRKHQSAQVMVLYERLGVFSIFQTDLLGYKRVRGGAADGRARSTAASPLLPYTAHGSSFGMRGTDVSSRPVCAAHVQTEPRFPKRTPWAGTRMAAASQAELLSPPAQHWNTEKMLINLFHVAASPKTVLLRVSCKPERRSNGRVAEEPGQRQLWAAPSTKPGCPKSHCGSTPATVPAQGPQQLQVLQTSSLPELLLSDEYLNLQGEFLA